MTVPSPHNLTLRMRHLEERTITPEGVRQIVREELAGVFGLILRRTQTDEAVLTRSSERNIADEVVRERLAHIFGELLREYGE